MIIAHVVLWVLNFNFQGRNFAKCLSRKPAQEVYNVVQRFWYLPSNDTTANAVLHHFDLQAKTFSCYAFCTAFMTAVVTGRFASTRTAPLFLLKNVIERNHSIAIEANDIAIGEIRLTDPATRFTSQLPEEQFSSEFILFQIIHAVLYFYFCLFAISE